MTHRPRLQHPTRAFPRPLRPGDRVRDLRAAANPHGPNYPGSARFGTVRTVPVLPQGRDTLTGAHYYVADQPAWVVVSMDDGFHLSAPVTDLIRL